MKTTLQKIGFEDIPRTYLRSICYVLLIISLVKLFKEILICGGVDRSAIPTCPMYYRYPYVSFAELSEERIRGDRRGISNKRVCSRGIEGQQRKESVVSNKRISQSISSCEVRKVS